MGLTNIRKLNLEHIWWRVVTRGGGGKPCLFQTTVHFLYLGYSYPPPHPLTHCTNINTFYTRSHIKYEKTCIVVWKQMKLVLYLRNYKQKVYHVRWSTQKLDKIIFQVYKSHNLLCIIIYTFKMLMRKYLQRFLTLFWSLCNVFPIVGIEYTVYDFISIPCTI